MPYDLFWHGPISAYLQFRAAHISQKREINHTAWLHGVYVMRAIGAGIGGKYPENPIALYRVVTPEQEQKSQEMKSAILQHNENMRKIQEEQAAELQKKMIEKVVKCDGKRANN